MAQKKYLLYASQNYAFAILRPIQQAILARSDTVVWFLKGNDINREYIVDTEQVLNTIEDVMAYKPDAVITSGNLVPDFISGLKVQVFHGFNVRKRSDERGHFNIRGCFDLYCTQGPNTTKPFEKLAEKHQFFSVKETGWSAIDTLYSTSERSDKKPTILLCSTFTPALSCAETLFETVTQLSRSGNWQWIVQFHPKMAQETVNKYKRIQSDHLQFVETDNVIPLLQKADVMVCDTSSVLSMFLLLNKPVVTFKNTTPQKHLLNISEPKLLEETIEMALSKPPELMDKIAEFIDDTHPYRDGKSAERVLNAIEERLLGNNKPQKNKPLNMMRNLKIRKSLNYWKFW